MKMKMKKLLTVLTIFFVATTLFAQKDIHENARYKNLPEEDFRLDYHKNDMMHKQLSEKEHIRELEKNNRKTTYKGKANEQDSLALVALYNATDGDNWTNNTNWLTGNAADWYGIILDGNGRVTEINLSFNQLTGNIPAEIGNLTSLTCLNLGYNQLTENIPPEIGNLTNLTELILSFNQLTGSIPTEIGNLTSLESLYLQANQLAGNIPPEIGDLTNLIKLSLNDNQFEDLPNLSSSASMYNLSIYNNKFTFEDIEPNVALGYCIHYSPQAKIGSVEHYTPNAGDNLDLSITTGGTANTYQWYKDDASISGATNSTYSITDYNSIDDAGVYMCKINNTIAVELTLETRNIYVGTDVTTFEISASANPIESGTITGTGTYNDGATAELTATPETGYNFTNWTEDDIIVSVDAVYSFNVDEDRTLIANFESTVSIPELENEISFTVYPNPARDIVNIQLNTIEDNNIQLNMYDFYGRKININTNKINTSQIQINVSDKSAGIYYLQIISAGKFSETVKLIITE